MENSELQELVRQKLTAWTAVQRYLENRNNPLNGPELDRLLTKAFAADDALTVALPKETGG